jgi:hypothetical protein
MRMRRRMTMNNYKIHPLKLVKGKRKSLARKEG